MTDITFFGKTSFRNQNTRFGIKPDDRRRHMYIIGKTGMGKTTILENMVISDILAGKGVGVVDPHGDFAEKILNYIPKERIKDVIYFNPSDNDYPIAFNPLEQVTTEHRHLIASGIMGVFKKIWPDVWSARMEYILNNALLTLLEFPHSTILGVMRLLSDKDYRKNLVDQMKDPVVKGFWVNEFARYAQKFETEATAAIQNKIGQLVSNPLIRNILGQARSAMNLREAIDKQQILIFNLSKGRMGEDNSSLLGAMIITKLQLAAMSRVDLPEHERKDFYLYVDEFQNFATDSFANILSEARKYRLCLILAHQYIGQLIHDLNTKVRDAVFGNVGTIITFRVGAEDAEFLEKEFTPDFEAVDLVNLAKYNIYVKLMIDGVASRPFSANTLEPYPKPAESYVDDIINYSRKTYGTLREVVEKKIAAELLVSEKITEEKFPRRYEQPLARALSGAPQPFVRRSPAQPFHQSIEGVRPPNRDGYAIPTDRQDMPTISRQAQKNPSSTVASGPAVGVARSPATGELSSPVSGTSPSGEIKASWRTKPKVNIEDLKNALEKALEEQSKEKKE